MMKWIHYIGIGSIAWWIIDVLLPFIPFGGLALLLGLAYIGILVLKSTLFKDSNSNSTSFGSSSNIDSEVNRASSNADHIQL